MSENKDAQAIREAEEWLKEATTLLDLPEETATALTDELLELTKEVAHNRSRPGAPLTAFLVGLASKDIDEARDYIVKIKGAI